MELRFPPTAVPGRVTSLFCMFFDLPSDRDYHIKAYDAIIDNDELVHHMLMFAVPEVAAAPEVVTPFSCDKGGGGTLLGAWSPGVPGKCLGNDLGFRVGKSGIKTVNVEIHWNNAKSRTDLTDSSGFMIWLQPATDDVQDLTFLVIGQQRLLIPPRLPYVKYTATCSSKCTELLSKPIFVYLSVLHMHRLGKEIKLEVFKDGRLVKTLGHTNNYDFLVPKLEEQHPYFMILPGDDIKLTCVYNSTSRDTCTHQGHGSNNEMCSGFIAVFPANAFVYKPDCRQIGDIESCQFFEAQANPIEQTTNCTVH